MYQFIVDRIINRFREVIVQGFKFALVGLVNTLLDYAIYISLTRLTTYFNEHYLLANAISFSIAVVCSYILNSLWTFNTGVSRSLFDALKYILTMAIGSLLLVQIILYLSVDIFAIYDLIGKAVGVILGFLWNFFIVRKWVFRN